MYLQPVSYGIKDFIQMCIYMYCKLFYYSNYIPMHHARPASIGVVFSSISLPYKHNPASSLRVSRAPKPASFIWSLCSNRSDSSTALSEGSEICNKNKNKTS